MEKHDCLGPEVTRYIRDEEKDAKKIEEEECRKGVMITPVSSKRYWILYA